MKRIISVILTTAMMMTAMCPFAAAAGEVTEKKVFSLDISEYAENGVVKNGVTDSDDGITMIKFTDNTSSNGPVIGKDFTADGDIIEYLEFTDDAEWDWTGASSASASERRTAFRNEKSYGAVRLSPALMQTLLAGTDDMTIEFWARPYANFKHKDGLTFYSTASSNLYTYGVGTDGAQNASMFAVYDSNNCDGYNNTYNIDVLGKNALYNNVGTRVAVADSQYSRTTRYLKHTDNPWIHYVITKEWRYDDETKTTGDYYGKVYENGVDRTASGKGDSTAYENVVKNDESSLPLIIGGSDNGTAGNAATAVFDGAIAEFNIYNYAMTSEDAIALHTNSKDTYSGAFKAQNGLKLVKPAASENAVSVAPSGSIEVEFDNYVNTDTLDDITIENADGIVAATVTPSFTGTAVKKATLTYSGLDKSTEYFLNVPATVKNKLGDSLENPQKIKLMTTDGSLIALDMSGSVPDDRFFYSGNDGDFSVTTYNGVKSIKMRHTAKSTNYFGYAFGKTETRDFIIYVTLAVEGTSNQRAIRHSYNENVMNIASNSSLDSYADSNGFATFKFEMLYDSTDDKYDVYMYDEGGNQVGKLLNSAKANDRCGIFIQQYNDASSTVAAYISDYRIYIYERPEVVSHNMAGLMPDEATLTLGFNVAVDADTLTDCAALADKAGTKNVPIKIGAYNELTRTLSVELLEYLDGNTEYTLSLKNIKSEDDAAIKDGYSVDFTTGSYVTIGAADFKNQNGATITNLQGATAVALAVRVTNKMDTKQKYTAYLAWCDSNGNVKAPLGVCSGEAVKDAYVDLTPALPTVAPSAGDCIKCFIWGEDAVSGGKLYAAQTAPMILQY